MDYPTDVPLLIVSGTMYDTFNPKVRPQFSKFFYEGSEIPLNTGNGRKYVRDRVNINYPLLGATSANVVLTNGLSTCSGESHGRWIHQNMGPKSQTTIHWPGPGTAYYLTFI